MRAPKRSGLAVIPMLSDVFLMWMMGVMCCVASIDRPDRYTFWLCGAWLCIASTVANLLIGATS